MFSLTSPNLTRTQLRHSSARGPHSVEIIAAAAVGLLASASTVATAAESAARLAQEQHACVVVLRLDPSGRPYDACLRSLDRSLSKWDYARSIATDRTTCDQDGFRPGTSAFAVCVVTAVQFQ